MFPVIIGQNSKSNKISKQLLTKLSRCPIRSPRRSPRNFCFGASFPSRSSSRNPTLPFWFSHSNTNTQLSQKKKKTQKKKKGNVLFAWIIRKEGAVRHCLARGPFAAQVQEVSLHLYQRPLHRRFVLGALLFVRFLFFIICLKKYQIIDTDSFVGFSWKSFNLDEKLFYLFSGLFFILGYAPFS